MKKILILNYEFPPIGGGGGTVAENLAKLIALENVDITVITSWCKGLAKEEIKDGYKIRRYFCFRSKRESCSPLEMLAFVIFTFVPTLVFCIKARPSVLHCHFGIPSGIVAYLCFKLTKVPYIITAHGSDIPIFNKPYVSKKLYLAFRTIKPFTNCVWRNASAVVCSNGYFKELIRQDYPFTNPQIISFGVDHDYFYPKKKIKDGKVRLIFVGRLSSQKGLPLLIKALSHLYNEIDWCLKIVGDGPERNNIEEIISINKLGERINITGWQDRSYVRSALWNADILLFPSVQESFGLVMLEAISTGTPVIASNLPILKEIAEQTKLGLVINNWDKELSGAINDALKLALDPDCLRNYSWSQSAESYYRLYLEIGRD